MSSLDSTETKSIDDLLQHLVIETCDFKKIRLSRFIYSHFKLFNDYMELLNGEKKPASKEENKKYLMQIDIPFKMMNEIVCLLWKKDRETVYSKYKEVCGYLGFNDIDIDCNDRLYDLIIMSDAWKKISKNDDQYVTDEEFKLLSNYEFSVKCNFISRENLKNIRKSNDLPIFWTHRVSAKQNRTIHKVKKMKFVDDNTLKLTYGIDE